MREIVVFVCLFIVILNLSPLLIAGNSDVAEMSNCEKISWISCCSQAAVAVFTFALIILAYLQFYKRLKEDSRYRMYDYLASLYYRIFEIGIEHPELIDKNRTKHYQSSFTEDQTVRYDAYAHMVWAHAEDIFDRATTKKFKRLKKIYEPTLKRYYELHGTWYENNKTRFPMEGFDEFVKKYDPD